MKPFGARRLGWVCVVAGTLALAFVSGQSRRQQHTLATLREALAVTQKTTAVAAVTPSEDAPAELARLRDAHLELLRLRGEVTRWRQSATGTNGDAEARSLVAEQQRLAREAQNLAGMKQRATCLGNLEKIYQAKKQWAARNPGDPASPVTLEDLREFMDGQIPVCPAGGVYSPNRIGPRSVAPPSCSVHGSLIPE